ncbi:glycosyltransferase family 2 protein [Fusobacterium mortiferum]|uniref:glycosyltransferase family A protein n=1 Tax=Fusobacterium mortiferum TaxID=850 RepID=UPI001F475013|nr:glycosyltransferase family A protein [Fusobacterium mortiferum]MCF2627778.1 glycosyltransferase family 2 protein [Fusobacterium mortiferum]
MKQKKIEVLLSCMNQKDFSITEKMNLTTDILIVNQCNENKYEERVVNGKKQRMIYTTQRGLSQSRNELLNNMEGDIGILCDDDVIYKKDYEAKIKKAYLELKNADIVIFNMNELNLNSRKKSKKITLKRRAPKYKNYSSVRITFKKDSFYKNNLWFNKNFGVGAKYSLGEESLLLREANRKKLKIYEYPEIIADVDFSNSSWFKGFNEKYFYDKGAWLKEAYPYTYFIFKWYFIFKFSNKDLEKMIEINKWLKKGIEGYKKGLRYNKEKN